jgi:hypothetical protein|tara:strand:- start:719 stop:1129 length:411 start_codon:yes stop_codon:yes gene_type:complete
MALVTYLDGARKLLNQYVIAAGDATGAQSLSIDVSALAKNNGKECTHVSLNKVYFNVQVTDNADAVEMQWDADTQRPFIVLNGYDDYDFSSVGGISPTTADKAASGYTGDVTIVNPARAAGDTIFIKMEWIKHYAN